MSDDANDTSHRAYFVHGKGGPLVKFKGWTEAHDPTPSSSLQPLIEQCRLTLEAQLYYAALVVALTLPDMCSSLASDDGRGTGALYKAWLYEHAGVYKADAALLWGLRCSLLHQGSAFPDGQRDLRVMLIEPGAPRLFDFVVFEVGDEQAFVIDLVNLVLRLCASAEAWLEEHGQDPNVVRNMARTVHRRPSGLLPFVEGLPVFA